jgi:hypothetical protein
VIVVFLYDIYYDLVQPEAAVVLSEELQLASMLPVAFQKPTETSQPTASLDQIILPDGIGIFEVGRIAMQRFYVCHSSA